MGQVLSHFLVAMPNTKTAELHSMGDETPGIHYPRHLRHKDVLIDPDLGVGREAARAGSRRGE